MKIFVINPGSTSTKIALYENEESLWVENIHHTADELSLYGSVNEQYDFRKQRILQALTKLRFL